MTFTITFGWWILPALVSVIGLLFAVAMNGQGSDSGGGFLDTSSFFSFINYVIFFIVPSLTAWLLWSLLK